MKLRSRIKIFKGGGIFAPSIGAMRNRWAACTSSTSMPSYCTADLHLCFCIYRIEEFSHKVAHILQENLSTD